MATDYISSNVSNAANQAAIAAAAKTATPAQAFLPAPTTRTVQGPVIQQPTPATPATPATPTTFTQADVNAAVQAALAKQTADAAAARQTTVNDAFGQFQAQFQALGLGNLANALLSKVTAPDAPTTSAGWYAALQATPEYQDRFGKTNAMRTANGLPQLSEGDILKSDDFQAWLASYGVEYTKRMGGMPLGNIVEGKEITQKFCMPEHNIKVSFE